MKKIKFKKLIPKISIFIVSIFLIFCVFFVNSKSIIGASSSYIYNPQFNMFISNDVSNMRTFYNSVGVTSEYYEFQTSGRVEIIDNIICNITYNNTNVTTNILSLVGDYNNLGFDIEEILFRDINQPGVEYAYIEDNIKVNWIDILSYEYYSSSYKQNAIIIDRLIKFNYSFSFEAERNYDFQNSYYYYSDTIINNPIFEGNINVTKEGLQTAVRSGDNNLVNQLKYNNISSNNMGIYTASLLNHYLNFTDYTLNPDLSQSNYTFSDLFLSILNIPIIYLQNLFSFEILGINVYVILFSIIIIGLTVTLAIFIFRGSRK